MTPGKVVEIMTIFVTYIYIYIYIYIYLTKNDNKVIISLLFIGKLSTDIKKSLVNIFKRTAPHLKLKVAFVSNVRLLFF